MAFYNKCLDDIYSELNSCENGLKNNQVNEKTAKYGKNIIEKPKKYGFFIKFLNQFKNLMIIILIISAIISVSTSIIQNDRESLFEGVLIFAIVLLNAVVGVIQEQKAENALESLMSSTEPYAKVYRDCVVTKIKVKDIVPGDVVELSAGNIVPADIRIIKSQNLKCNESSLTGESHAVEKNNKTIKKQNVVLNDQENMCFSGTSITSGNARGIVVETGKNTEIGKIAKMLDVSKKEKTPLEKNIDKISKVLTFLILAIVVIVFVVQVIFNKNQTLMQSLLVAVALAVAAIPESLQTIITIIMAIGVVKLAKQNAIVKKLSAVETLGSCNVICSDKTGTLTQNEMTVTEIFDNSNLTNIDYKIIDEKSKITQIASLCNNAIISNKNITADATEKAIIKLLLKNKIDINFFKKQTPRIYESEFNSTKKMMSVICEDGYIYSKGAIDYILKKCKYALINNEICTINDSLLQKIINNHEKACEKGERVIAFAYKKIDNIFKNNEKISNNQINNKNSINNITENNNGYINKTENIKNNNSENIKNQLKNLSEKDLKNILKANESDMIFAGFFGLVDPPRTEAEKSIKQCKKAGLKVIMITGDHPSTAFTIAKQLKIANNKKQVLTGQELNKLTKSQLNSVINQYSVFARVTPEHKLLIVNALKASGNVVAMTGDGVNDAPSIKQANIGVAMGKTGTDVTKEVADIIISDDNFSTIVVAVKQGRAIYQNISKTILFLLSTNIVEVLGIFVTSLMMPGSIFLSPAQILFINLVTDSLPAFALGVEEPEKNIMEKPPRNANDSILSGVVGSSIIYQGFIQSLIVLVMFVLAKYNYGDNIANTMSFLTICFMQIIHSINCKSEKSIFKMNIFKNKFFNFSFIVLFVMIISICFIPFCAALFDIAQLQTIHWLIIAITSISIIPLVEIGKIFIK